MKTVDQLIFRIILSTFLALTICSCTVEDDPAPNPEPPDTGGVIESPATQIPDELVGTWYADHNSGPLTTNWEQGTFQGESGFREFRTMVLTKDGKNAVEYTTETFNLGDEVKQRFYKMTGTLEYQTNPASLIFHAQAGKMRVFSNKYAGYTESDIIQKDVETHTTVWQNPSATTFPSSTNYLDAKRLDGAIPVTVRYIKVDGNTTPNNPNPADLYAKPPTTGTFVKMGNHHYPTVSIGDLEWMSVNYAGPGGINDAEKPHYGTFIKYMDLKDISIPAGWRIPTKEDYLKLLQSQGIKFDEVWESTDGDDLQSKKLLGQLMAPTGWLKQDGLANNKSGFNAVPANIRVTNGAPQGEGYNCLLWTSELDKEGNPVFFKIYQYPSDTVAGFGAYPFGYNPAHIPLRLVKDK